MKKIAIVVDAYSTGARLPREFSRYGVNCIHVQSSTNVTQEFIDTFNAADFILNLVSGPDGSLPELAGKLREYAPICVVAGTETAVETAEALAALLQLPGNSPHTSRLRRDKYFMHEKLREAGLSKVRQARCDSPQAATAWARLHNLWPVVLKPVASAGADGVTFCHNLDEVEEAAKAVIGKRNKLGETNEAVVLQERLVGQQFIVNAVSVGGRHYISEIWRDDKIPVAGASLVCDREVLLEPDSEIGVSLQRYVVACLDALGVTDGPSHSELFQTESGDLVLIETAARMQGTIDHEAVIEATGHSHVTLTAMRYAAPEEFSKLPGTTYKRRINLHCVTLCSDRSGIVESNRCAALIGTLSSFRSLIHTPKPGDHIARTVDLFTNPGIAYLANGDESCLEREYQQIRKWERTGELFTFA